MAQRQIADLIDALIEQIGTEHGAKGDTLAQQLPKIRRALPRRLRRDAAFLAEIEPLARHPKIKLQIDHARAHAAYDRLHRHLRQIGAGRRRMDIFLSVMGTMAFAVLALIAAAVAVLRWRGDL